MATGRGNGRTRFRGRAVLVLVVLVGLVGVTYVLARTALRPDSTAVSAPVRVTPSDAAAALTAVTAQMAQQPAQPVVSLELTPSTPARVVGGQRVTFTLTFTLTSPAPTAAETGLAWREPDGSLKQGALAPYQAAPGVNTLKDFAWFSPGAANKPGTVFSLFGVVKVAGTTFMSPGVVVTVVTPEEAARAPLPGPQSGPISGVELIPTSPTQVPAGTAVRFDLKFTLNAREKTQVEVDLAWREPNGTLTYGTFSPFVAAPGPNVSGFTFTPGTAVPPGTAFGLFGVVRAGGSLYSTQTPVMVTVTAVQTQQPQQPQAPQPAQPGQPQVPQPPVPIPPVPDPPQTQRPEDVDFVTYREPDNRFEIEYPKGWRYQRADSWVIFYKDHPESAAFFLTPAAGLRGRLSNRDLVSFIASGLRKKYPDFTVTSQELRTLVSGPAGKVSIAKFGGQWTNPRRERMQGFFGIYVMFTEPPDPVPGIPLQPTGIPGIKDVPPQGPGQPVTYFMVMAYQAPAVAYSAMEPVFIEMYRSYRQVRGLPAPM